MKVAQNLIEKRISNLKIDLEAETPKGDKVKDVFCKVAPYAEEALSYGMLAVKNPIARWVLGLALAILKSVEDKNCGK